MPNESPAYVFLDANSVLHFKRPDQIDWAAIVGTVPVELVAAPILLRELEKQKVHNPSRRLRDRADKLVRWLATLLEGPDPSTLRDRVTFRFLPHEPQINFLNHKLSESLGDDQLIASVLAFRENDPTASVLIATGDIGLRAKIRSRGIAPIVLPDCLKLPDEPDAAERELVTLRREIAELKARQPKLVVEFKDGFAHLSFPRRAVEAPDVEAELARAIAENPTIHSAEAAIPEHIRSLLDLTTRGSWSAANMRRYNLDIERYISQYRDYLVRLCEFNDFRARTLLLECTMKNVGTALATDIDAVLEFPDDVTLCDSRKAPKRPKAPAAPSPYSGRLGQTAELDWLNIVPNYVIPSFVLEGPNKIRFRVRKLKHGLSEILEPILATFGTCAAVRSCPIRVEISAAELPSAVKHDLHIVVTDPET